MLKTAATLDFWTVFYFHSLEQMAKIEFMFIGN